MRVALDTNLLIYAEGVDGPERKAAAIRALRPYRRGEVILPVQVLGEFFAVLTRKMRWEADAARRAAMLWLGRTVPVATTESTLQEAMQIVVAHRLSSWDAVVLAAAAQAGCDVLLTEDLQDGFVWRGVTVRNPFAAPG
jgi:predicted nucleic acid-binding protein